MGMECANIPKMTARKFLPFLLLLALAACQATEPHVEIHGQRYFVEIADDDATRQQGLMFRDEMAENRGMLFIFRREEPRSFWMRNTRIPLDIIYLDSDMKVVSISADTPPCRTSQCPGYPSTGPAQYVLELNAGQAQALNLKPGDPVIPQNIPGIEAP